MILTYKTCKIKMFDDVQSFIDEYKCQTLFNKIYEAHKYKTPKDCLVHWEWAFPTAGTSVISTLCNRIKGKTFIVSDFGGLGTQVIELKMKNKK